MAKTAEQPAPQPDVLMVDPSGIVESVRPRRRLGVITVTPVCPHCQIEMQPRPHGDHICLSCFVVTRP